MKRHFTLLELLIVIGILAILLGMLMPALNAARRKAQNISCSGNLKQFALAYVSYSYDWNSTPPVSLAGSRWVDRMEPYLARKSQTSAGNIFVCPSDMRPEEKKVVYGTSDINKLSYGINQCYSKGYETETAYKLWYGVAFKLIRSPSEFITVADAGAYYIGTTIAQPEYGEENGEFTMTGGFCKKLSFRHNGISREFNAAFGDGHVSLLKFNSTPSRYWDIRNEWNGNF